MNSLFELLEKILASEDGAEIAVPEENFNFLMLKILKNKARKENHQLNLIATGPKSKKLIEQLGGEEVEATPAVKEEEKPSAPLKVKPPRKFKFRRLFWVLLILLVVLVVLGGIAYWLLYYFPRAEINLTLKPIPLVKEISVAADTTVQEVNSETNVIPGIEKVQEETGEKETAATGSATVGEKAKGTVTFTSAQIQNCSQGTKIQETSSSLVFFTDAAVNFDSPGNKDVSVTAEKIGSNYNLSAGKDFSVVSGCSVGGVSISGTNSAAFTGGTSQQVKVVAAADRTKLLEELKTELTDKAKTALAGTGDEVVVAEAIKSEVVEESYSHAAGEQADKVSLTLKMKFTTISYRGADMQDLISQVIADLVPERYTLFPGETVVDPLDPVLADTRLSFKAKVTAQVVPEVDVEKIKTELASRNIPSAQEYLAGIGEITGYKLNLYPSNLPERFQRIPRNPDKITINLVTEQKEEQEQQEESN